jgi:hypothetical protein
MYLAFSTRCLLARRTGHRTSTASAVERLAARSALTRGRSLTWGRFPTAAGDAATTAVRLLRRRHTTGEEHKREHASEHKFHASRAIIALMVDEVKLTRWGLLHLGHKLAAPNRAKMHQLPPEIRPAIHECTNCGWMYVIGRFNEAVPFGPELSQLELSRRKTEPCSGPILEADREDLSSLTPPASSEISKAFARLRTGDESGAISSACGAVDLITNEIYYRHGEPDPKDQSFASRVREATKFNGTYDLLERELEALSMDPADVKFVRENLKRAVGATAEVLGRLRSSMGDVHGSKPALQRMVWTCIKLASVITGLLEEAV